MCSKMNNGRPPKPRNAIAGDNLRQALLALGKHWRKNTADPNHVLNWDRWLSYGLPHSPNTIDAHIRLGIPEDRLGDYAKCLQLPAGTLTDPTADMRQALRREWSEPSQAAAPLNFGYGAEFQKKYLGYNSEDYTQALFDLLNGVYLVQYVTPTMDIILQCSFFVYAAEKHFLRAKGLFIIFGFDNITTANIFRWHNNLHAIFHCHNMMELGHYLIVDPLRHHLVSRRTPFWLRGQGVTDNGQANNAPTVFTFRMEKLARPDGLSLEDFFRCECEALRARPAIAPDDAAYAATRQRIEAVDDY
ncbi:MAG: hypothetical protein ACP59X_16795 [Solidesulfovibrio sp. DCME]|uniref:hypothetical protein n=1 Tax=Solidesulfovibrio sp. DCME TaxID=3447380 RepID=UPI003D111E1B